MKNLEVKTLNAISRVPQYKENISIATVFLSNSEDRISTIAGNGFVQVEIHENGTQIFCGTKDELFKILKNKAID